MADGVADDVAEAVEVKVVEEAEEATLCQLVAAPAAEVAGEVAEEEASAGMDRAEAMEAEEEVLSGADGLYSVEQTNGTIVEVPQAVMAAGIRERVLIMPQVKVDVLKDHLRLMWPEPVSDDEIEVLVEGKPQLEGAVVLRSLREGNFAFRVLASEHVHVPCLADPNWSGW